MIRNIIIKKIAHGINKNSFTYGMRLLYIWVHNINFITGFEQGQTTQNLIVSA